MEHFEFAIDVTFMIDIFVQFNTSFYSKGLLITSRKEIVRNYVMTWFFVDLVASFPYNLMLPKNLSIDQVD